MQRFHFGLLVLAIAQSACGELPPPSAPDDLIPYIQSMEKAEIRESWGEQAGECFTWVDYDAFVHDRRPAVVAGKLKASPRFQKLAELIRPMPQADRERLLARARGTARPTWAMIGRISTEGTTDAGRKAGLLLASAITDAVEELLKRP